MSATYSIDADLPRRLRKRGNVSPNSCKADVRGGSLATNRRAMARNDSSPARRRTTGKRAARASIGLATASAARLSSQCRLLTERAENDASAPGSKCLKLCWILRGVATVRSSGSGSSDQTAAPRGLGPRHFADQNRKRWDVVIPFQLKWLAAQRRQG